MAKNAWSKDKGASSMAKNAWSKDKSASSGAKPSRPACSARWCVPFGAARPTAKPPLTRGR